jgi:hypothetical protein
MNIDSVGSVENEVLYHLDSENLALSIEITQMGVDEFAFIGREMITESPDLVSHVTPETATLVETEWVLPVADIGAIRWSHDLQEVTACGVEMSATTVATLVAIGVWLDHFNTHG